MSQSLFNGEYHHLLAIADLTREQLLDILNRADSWVNNPQKLSLLQDVTLANLFFEPSTRTHCSFQLAAFRLGAMVLDLDVFQSSTQKGETVLDTVANLHAMGVDVFIVRHQEEGIVQQIARYLQPGGVVINAGDGCHAHPTQALLDMLTIRRHFKCFESLSVAIIGDIIHSRVARSQLKALELLGVRDIRLIGPREFLPTAAEFPQASLHEDLRAGLENVDVIITLRIQKERIIRADLVDEQAYSQHYGLTNQQLRYAKPTAIVMHPGPINRGVEISSEVADGPQSVILQQVALGVPVRMAVIASCCGV